MLHVTLERDGVEVVAVASLTKALSHIAAETFDVLLSDLHMPHAGDGFAVVSAMRHTHPHSVTLMLSGYPALDEALSAVKPTGGTARVIANAGTAAASSSDPGECVARS